MVPSNGRKQTDTAALYLDRTAPLRVGKSRRSVAGGVGNAQTLQVNDEVRSVAPTISPSTLSQAVARSRGTEADQPVDGRTGLPSSSFTSGPGVSPVRDTARTSQSSSSRSGTTTAPLSTAAHSSAALSTYTLTMTQSARTDKDSLVEVKPSMLLQEQQKQKITIVGGTVGGIVGALVVIILACCIYKRKTGQSAAFCCARAPEDGDRLGNDLYEMECGLKQQPSILILYSYDCEAHEQVVVEFALYLKHICYCNVSVDIWEQNEVMTRGAVQWLVEKLDACDYIIVICSTGARFKCIRTKKMRMKQERPVPDIFSLALEYVTERMWSYSHVGQALDKFVVAYFDYAGENDIPPKLDKAKRFCLMADIFPLFCHLHAKTEAFAEAGGVPCTVETLGRTSETLSETENGSQLIEALMRAKGFFQNNPDWIAEILEPIPDTSSPSADAGNHQERAPHTDKPLFQLQYAPDSCPQWQPNDTLNTKVSRTYEDGDKVLRRSNDSLNNVNQDSYQHRVDIFSPVPPMTTSEEVALLGKRRKKRRRSHGSEVPEGFVYSNKNESRFHSDASFSPSPVKASSPFRGFKKIVRQPFQGIGMKYSRINDSAFYANGSVPLSPHSQGSTYDDDGHPDELFGRGSPRQSNSYQNHAAHCDMKGTKKEPEEEEEEDDRYGDDCGGLSLRPNHIVGGSALSNYGNSILPSHSTVAVRVGTSSC